MILPFFFVPLFAPAEDLYLTPQGAGDRDGRSWEHALAAAAMTETVNQTMQPGDRLLLGGGNYGDVMLTISVGGAAEKPKTILGVDRGDGPPVFESTWSVDEPSKGATAIRLEPGVSHLIVQQLLIRRYMTGVKASPSEGKHCSDIVFANVDMEQLRYGFYLSNCDGLRLENCDIKRYTKHGFRFEEGCRQVTVRGCGADCSEGDEDWESKTELLPFGFLVNNGGAPHESFLFEDCLAVNNLMPLQNNRYKNGDGFVVEGNAKDVVFRRCRGIRNQDAGFDLKSPDVRLQDCVALRNSRNFRIWAGGSLENCFAGWGSTGLWSNGAAVTAKRCTFHELKTGAMTDDRATEPVALIDCLVSQTAQTHRRTASGGGGVQLEGTEVVKHADFVRPAEDWDGLGEAMNSRAFPEKGYRSVVGQPIE